MIKPEKLNRLEHANQLIKIISDHGRRFFFNSYHNRIARLVLNQQGKVYFYDDYTGKAIYTHETAILNKWKGFSHGGTLKSLVKLMRDYIITGKKIPIQFIGLESCYTSGNIWGYDKYELNKVLQDVKKLPIISN